jgi:AAA family ATP:ADP antiporter
MPEANASTRNAVAASIAVAIFAIGQLIASQAIRDGFFLSQFEATALPPMVVGGSLLSLFFVWARTRLFRHTSPERILPIIFVVNGVLFFCEWALIDFSPRSAAIVLFFHVACLGALLVSAFWSVVNERFDPREARNNIARIGGGATLGGVLGALGAGLAATTFEISTMILFLGALNLFCAYGASRMSGGQQVAPPAEAGQASSTLEIFEETPYLRNIALLVGLGAFCQAVYDYVFKATAASFIESGSELISFFALFHLSVGILTFIVQNLLSGRMLARFGLTINVQSLPASGALLGIGALLFPGLASAAAMRGGIGIAENSLFRSGYELLYTPVAPEKKRPTKSWIDVGGDKAGTALGGGAAFLVIGLFPSFSSPLLIVAGIVASLASLRVARKLQQGYVASLASKLRSGSLAPEDVVIEDATTRFVLSDTTISDPLAGASASLLGTSSEQADPLGLIGLRTRLREGLRARKTGRVDARKPFVASPAPAISPQDLDPIVTAIASLRSQDPSRMQSVLAEHHPLPRDLIPHVIRLLGDARIADTASVALKRIAPANTGALLDAALQTRTPLPVRRTLCQILGRLSTQRSVNGLVELLLDGNFELRFRAAASLLRIHRTNPAIRLPRALILEVAEREAAYCRKLWRSHDSVDQRLSRTEASQSKQGRRVAQGLTFISTLLLILHDQEAMTVAFRGLADGGLGQRGTALEYLENVLPSSLFVELRPLIEDSRLTGRRVTSRSEMLAEIVRSESSEVVDLSAIRARVDAARAGR